jgi:hypothetical protein
MSEVRTLAALRVGVERQECELRAAFTELATATRSIVDPKQWIQDRPLVCVVGALVFGAWLGGRARVAH